MPYRLKQALQPPCQLARQRPDFDCIALLLQGGGALGAYQAGVYEALAEADLHPELGRGHFHRRDQRRLDRRQPARGAGREAAELLGRRSPPIRSAAGRHRRRTSAAISRGRGEPLVRDGCGIVRRARASFPRACFTRSCSRTERAGATSFYDTSVVEDDAGAAGRLRPHQLRRNAFQRRRGQRRHRQLRLFRQQHARHSAPSMSWRAARCRPAFPPIEIEGEHYWDGGLVSNTPLQWVLECAERQDTLAFQVDVWSARGAVPRTLGEVATRHKEIQYSSRTRANSDQFKKEQKLRNALADLFAKLPDELKATPEFALLNPEAGRKVYNIIQLIYRSKHYEGESKDFEFSRRSMEDHWTAGLNDTVRTLRHPEVLERPTSADGVFTFDLARARTDVADERHRSSRARVRDAAHPAGLSAGPVSVLRPRIPDHHLSHRPREASRARAGAARGRLGPGEIRVHPDAGFDRLRRLYRGGPGHPGQVRRADGQLHA